MYKDDIIKKDKLAKIYQELTFSLVHPESIVLAKSTKRRIDKWYKSCN